MVIENYPEGQVEELEVTNNPRDETAGTRMVRQPEIWVNGMILWRMRRRNSSGSALAVKSACARLISDLHRYNQEWRRRGDGVEVHA